jgi:hypothetical protein
MEYLRGIGRGVIPNEALKEFGVISFGRAIIADAVLLDLLNVVELSLCGFRRLRGNGTPNWGVVSELVDRFESSELDCVFNGNDLVGMVFETFFGDVPFP